MIIESISIDSESEEGTDVIISGRSLESLLTRRIVWNQKSFTDEYNLQNAVKMLLNENVISPQIAARQIPNFIFEESVDEAITSLKLDAQYYGEELYTLISNLCKENDIGFKVVLNDENQLVFKFYAGSDRSYSQDINPYIVFSPDYDNVINTSYLESDKTLKNVTLIVGEKEDEKNEDELAPRVTYVLGFASGIDRREVFTDAKSLSSDVNGETLTIEQYQAHLRQRGIDTLIENTDITAFEGEVDPKIMFTYGEDYFVGDIVQIVNEYGHEGQARVSEFVISCDQNGTSTYPTFKNIQKGKYET
jgi:hypothetical protein